MTIAEWEGWYTVSGYDLPQRVTAPDFSWGAWRDAHMSDWAVAWDDIPDPVRERDIRVSTVFLGLDHAVGREPPILWESLVFNAEGTIMEDYMERYTSRREAEAGHKRICEAVHHMFTATAV